MRRNHLQLPTQFLFNILVWVSIVTGTIYGAACMWLFFNQTRFIFFPTSAIEKTPEFFDLAYEEVWLSVKTDSTKVEPIHGWWIPNQQADAKVLLYLHGNGINIGANVAHANRFHKLGFSVLLIDYRGYGRSGGSFPNETRVYEDAAVAWDYLVQQKQIPPQEIFIYGHSLGGAVAIDLAVKQKEAAGLIVESSFTSVKDVVTYRNTFWMFPVDLMLHQRFESIQKVSRLKMPVLFIHGSADVTVPSFMSHNLYNAAPEPKKLMMVAGAGHNNLAEIGGSEYIQVIESFIKQINHSRQANLQ